MPKCNIKVRIQNSEIDQTTEVKAIFQDNRIKYKEEDNTFVTFDYENNCLIRENQNLRMRYHFNEKEGIIEAKEYNRELKVQLNTKKIERNGKNIEIHFDVEESPFLYKIEEIIWVLLRI